MSFKICGKMERPPERCGIGAPTGRQREERTLKKAATAELMSDGCEMMQKKPFNADLPVMPVSAVTLFN